MLLIISENEYFSSLMSDMMRYMGVISYGIKPNLAAGEISAIYSAVLVLEDLSQASAIETVDAIRRKSEVPIFAILGAFSKNREVFDYGFEGEIYSSRLLKEIRRYAKERGKKEIGRYSLGELRATDEDKGIVYGRTRLPLTRVEGNILKLLMNCFPTPKSTNEILKYVYPTGKAPEPSSIRTHISVINKKFSELFGKNIITLVQSEGYRIGGC